MASVNTLEKQGKLENKKSTKVINIPNRTYKTTNRWGRGVIKLAPIQFKGGRLKGSKEAIKLRKETQILRKGNTVIC